MAEQENKPLIDPNIVFGGKTESAVATATKTEAQARKTTPDKGGFIWGTGRRKSSVARVRIKPGQGKILINEREVDKFFARVKDRNLVWAPLKAINGEKNFDVYVNVQGGGTTGQSGAIMLGIARALKNYDPGTLKQLRDSGYLTRDGRMVERKKPGKPGARRSFQFSKR